MDNEDFTHLIVGKPNRGEKFLMAISRGKFVLSEEYIATSYETGSFVDEAEYEFGNPQFLASLAEKFTVDALFKAPYKWRKWITDDHADKFQDGAFTGKSFIIVAGDKSSQFVTIIKAGGGKHIEIDWKEPLKPALLKRQKADYFICDHTKVNKEVIETIRQCNIAIKSANFINEILMRNTIPE